jgi:lipoprotein-anchoring transpeptidase ErfK/SrfK
VKRVLAVGLFLVGFAAAGTFSAAVIADTATTSTTTTSDTTTVQTTTTTTTTSAPVVPTGVRVAGVRVGGLAPVDAIAAVQTAFAQPLVVFVDKTRVTVDPTTVATAYVATAVARARSAAPGTNVALVVAVKGAPLRAWVAKAVHRFAAPATDAKVAVKNNRLKATPEVRGHALDGARLTQRIVAALRANTRLPVRVRTRLIAPKTTLASFGPTILINREINHLYLYNPAQAKLKLTRVFSVATGQSIYPTPKGTFKIVVKWKNPTWYPPIQDAWAKGLKPVPPGPGNPLGTRWMGLSAPGVGIHGTDEPGSIGYSASHGCIRMQVPDAEWLFNQVDIGTTVYIV